MARLGNVSWTPSGSVFIFLINAGHDVPPRRTDDLVKWFPSYGKRLVSVHYRFLNLLATLTQISPMVSHALLSLRHPGAYALRRLDSQRLRDRDKAWKPLG